MRAPEQIAARHNADDLVGFVLLHDGQATDTALPYALQQRSGMTPRKGRNRLARQDESSSSSTWMASTAWVKPVGPARVCIRLTLA
jgi:hypothetical protein